jgi:hypothetical protein
MMSFTHHALVRLAANQVGEKKFVDYLLLGDDIVIADEKVALRYIELMNSIGVSISMTKSVISNDTHCGVEFASQYIVNSINLRPLPIGLLYQQTVERLFLIWDTLLERGYGENCVEPEFSIAPDFRSV